MKWNDGQGEMETILIGHKPALAELSWCCDEQGIFAGRLSVPPCIQVQSPHSEQVRIL